MSSLRSWAREEFDRQLYRLPSALVPGLAYISRLIPNTPGAILSALGDRLLKEGKINSACDTYWVLLRRNPCYPRSSWRLRLPNIWKQALTPQRLSELRRIVADFPQASQAAQILSVWRANSGEIEEAAELNRLRARRNSKAGKFGAQQIDDVPSIPSFLLIGMPKSGTASLYAYMVRHPLIIAPIQKEIHFWSTYYDRGLEWYFSHFPSCIEPGEITGEASADYFHHPKAAARIRKQLPDIRLILLIRNPVDQVYSNYQMQVRDGTVSEPWSKVVARESTLMAEPRSHEQNQGLRQYDIFKVAATLPHLKIWHNSFPKEQLLVLRSEDLFADPDTVVNEVYRFLHLPPCHQQQYGVMNAAAYEPMPAATRRVLEDFFAPKQLALEEYLRPAQSQDKQDVPD